MGVNRPLDGFVLMLRRAFAKALRLASKHRRSSEVAKIMHAAVDMHIESVKTKRVACSQGCAYCCHTHVDIWSGEAFVLARAIKSMPDDRRKATMERMRDAAARIAGMGFRERFLSRIPCALLDPDTQSCSVYDARPAACRRWHSTRRESCEADFETANGGIPQDIPVLSIVHYVEKAYAQATADGFGELHRGVLMAMTLNAEKRYSKGENVFADWQSTPDGESAGTVRDPADHREQP